MKTFLLAGLAFLAVFSSVGSAQDDPMENPRLNPRLMKQGLKGVIPRSAMSLNTFGNAPDLDEWPVWIDTTWGEGLSTSTKLNVFDAFWTIVDEQYGGFPNLDIDWTALRDQYRPMVEAGLSRGKFMGVMSQMANALQEHHTWFRDTGIDGAFFFGSGDVYIWPYRRMPLVWYGGMGVTTSGMGVAPMPDSSLFVYRAQGGHPLGIQAGDIILGYDGMRWVDILRAFDSLLVPVCRNASIIGSHPESYAYERLNSASLNWWMFDTIDVVKYSKGDTVHLSTQPLADTSMFWDSLMCMDQIDVPGVPQPDVFNGDWVSWGIVEGTSIGYIYLWKEPKTKTSAPFLQAVQELMHTTTGLIIDIRGNWGGWPNELNLGFSYLFNENMDGNFDIAHRSSTSDHFLFSHESSSSFYSLGPFTPNPEIYDHPIAVLTGPGCLSAGDYTAYRLKYHPMVRFFGKKTNTAYVDGYYNEGATFISPYAHKVSKGSLYSITDGDSFIVHKGFPVDEEVWHNRVDAANGVDAVVKRAREWIDSACYAHHVLTDKSVVVPWTDSLQIIAVVENPHDHPISVKALLFHDGNLTDSVDLIQDTLYFPVPKSACMGVWPAPHNGGTYEITVRTTDPLTGQSFHLRHLAEVTVAGPVITPAGIDFGLSHADTARSDTLMLYNPSDYTLHIYSVSSDYPLAYEVSPSSAIVAPHEMTTFIVTFDPASYGVYDGYLVFTHDGAGSTSMVSVKGIYSIPSVELPVQSGWNMVSVPMTVDDFSVNAVFPEAHPVAWHYSRGYHAQPILVPGEGYWLKYEGAGVQEIPGLPIMAETVDVVEGWNIVGSITYPVPVGSIGSIPGGIMTTGFYCYLGDGTYNPEDTIKPGCAAWVKISEDGQLVLSAGETIPSANRIRIELTDEMPPPPPSDGTTEVVEPVPREYALEQNYPNPFNPMTVIEYTLPEGGQVKLSVFTILGQEVRTLVNEIQEAGYKTVSFDAGSLPSGVYTYRLTAGTFMEVKKMLLLK